MLTALIIGVISTSIMLCTVVPPPVMVMLPPSIAGAELSPWFVIVGLVVLGLAGPRSSWRRTRRGALLLSVVTIGLALRILVQIPAAIEAAETTMSAGFGPAYPALRDDSAASRLAQPAPISARAVLFGLSLPPVHVSAAVPMFTVAGQTLHADIYQPVPATVPAPSFPQPIVLAIHGGSWRSGSRAEAETCHRALAASGLVVITIDYRLVPEFRFPAQLEDVRAALAWVRAHAHEYGGDPNRIALLGRSAGAQLALLAAFENPAGVRCAVGFYSPVDFTIGYREPSHPDPLDARAVFRAFLGGTPDDRADLYRAASPIESATRPHPPTLLIYGGRDHLVELRFGMVLTERLRAHGTPVALLEIPWAEHAFDLIPHGLGAQLALHHLRRFLQAQLMP